MKRAAALAGLAALAFGGCGSEDPSEPPGVAGPPGAPALVVQDDAELLFAGPERAARAFDLLERSGVRAVRLNAGWSQLAPGARATRRPRFDAADPGAYRAAAWAPIDRGVRLARERGMAPMIDIAFWAPVWATAGDTSVRPRRRIDARAFAGFARAVARRYSGDYEPGGASEPLPAVRTFTLWNEPNTPGFLTPQRAGGSAASPHIYRRMLEAAYPAVKDEQPDSVVLVGALAAYGRARGVPPLEFLRELACVDRALRPLRRPECRGFERVPGDGFSHHPYSTRTRPDRVERSASADDVPVARLGELSALLDRLAAAGRVDPRLRDIYLTEYAYETNPPDPGAPFDPPRAARMMAYAELIASREPRVRTVAQFLVRDLPPSPAGQRVGSLPDWQSGLLFADGRIKPLAIVLPAPLHAESAGEGYVRLWGRVRPGEGRRPVRIEAAARGGARRVVFQGRTDRQGVVERELPAPRGTLFRISRRERGRWIPGPPVDVIDPAP